MARCPPGRMMMATVPWLFLALSVSAACEDSRAVDGASLQPGLVYVFFNQVTFPGGGLPVVSAPVGDEENASSIYQPGQLPGGRPEGPIRLTPGPHLFVDDFLIEDSIHLRRCINQPRRDPKIPNPLITGKEDECVAPYLTVIRDPGTGRFRIWYNIYKEKYKDGTARFATMESEDGVHWVRPHRVLDDPGTINFGCAVIDEGPDFMDSAKRYKLGWWSDGGLRLAVSADGVEWTQWKPYPVVRVPTTANLLPAIALVISFDGNRPWLTFTARRSGWSSSCGTLNSLPFA